uniref:ribosomal protein S4 n=1 Tax=Ulva meridionalis TaxID=434723 RepID=UPI0021150A40|nr:ribosomal protein S4 [Ulva meridionalis]UTA96538.1 ribosomal protein S4 [Ulva meridionalis]UTA96596.1 ribosomal protein S4 [Ulva meridionalis]UTA96648.1 ribosomal protein S4 [Ulva meridionalis]UTA96700.1 ribosomal protein S4 [Ulva meridionalis]UTA96763.1 ribosomal protein S4 [Ulva meridionalis]
MTSNSKKLNNTKIIIHLNKLNIRKVAVKNTKQLTLFSNKREIHLLPFAFRLSPLREQRPKAKGKKTKHIVFQGFFNKLLKTNNALVKLILLSFLKSSTSIVGFKQVLYNRIKIEKNRLYPSYNRRKHNHSHHILITNQLGKLSKTFHYLSKNKLKNFITLALRKALGYKAENSTIRPYYLLSRHVSTRSTPNLISILENQMGTLIWRNQFKHCLAYSRQALLHGNFQMLLKNNIALAIKKQTTATVFKKPNFLKIK